MEVVFPLISDEFLEDLWMRSGLLMDPLEFLIQDRPWGSWLIHSRWSWMNLSSIGSSLVIWFGWFGVTHCHHWCYGVLWRFRSISGYTESLGESNWSQRLLRQSSTISTSVEGPNIFVFVCSNYSEIIYTVQAVFCIYRVRPQEALQAAIFLN